MYRELYNNIVLKRDVTSYKCSVFDQTLTRNSQLSRQRQRGCQTYDTSLLSIKIIVIWLTDFMCCDWSIPGP